MVASLAFIYAIYLYGIEYKYALFNKFAFVETTPIILLFFFATPLLLLAVPVGVKRFKNPHYENSERVTKLMNICFVLCGIGVFSPILVGPLTSYYMKSNGYEKCEPHLSALQSIYTQYWAKPEIGCDVWDLDEKDRQRLKEKLLNNH